MVYCSTVICRIIVTGIILQVELFRELQMLSTDYLRQRALYSVQDLVTRYLTEEGVAQEAGATASMVSFVWFVFWYGLTRSFDLTCQ